MKKKEYAGISAFRIFLDNLKKLFATKNELDAKADKSEVDSKATKSTTLEGYGITNAYTKDESDEYLATKSSVQFITWGAED